MTPLLPSKFNVFACVLRLLLVGVVSETFGATRDTEATGVFINEGRNKVQVNVVSKDEKEVAEMILPPEAIERSVLFAGGQLRLYTPSKDVISGRLLFSRSAPTPNSAPEFMEKGTRTFYFRVTEGKIVLLKPATLTSKERRWLKERTKSGW